MEAEEDEMAELSPFSEYERDVLRSEREWTGDSLYQIIQDFLNQSRGRAKPYPSCDMDDPDHERRGPGLRRPRSGSFDEERELELERDVLPYGHVLPPRTPTVAPEPGCVTVEGPSMAEQGPAFSPKRKADDNADTAMDTDEQPSCKEAKREDDDVQIVQETAGEDNDVQIVEETTQGDVNIAHEIVNLLKQYFVKPVPETLEKDLDNLPRPMMEEMFSAMRRRENQLNAFRRSRRRMYAGIYRRRDPQDSDEDSEADSNVRLQEEQARFRVPQEVRLRRVLILGGSTCARMGNSSAIVESEYSVVREMIEEKRGEEVVDILKDLNERASTSRLNGLLYSLALCIRCENKETKAAAYSAVQDICRTPTHLFQLISLVEDIAKKSEPATTGWGRGLRRVVSRWYNRHSDNPMHLAMQVTKYGSRHEWSHRDLFRLSHIKPSNEVIGFIIRYLVKGLEEAEKFYLEDGYLGREQLEKIHKYLKAVDEAKKCEDLKRTLELIQEHRLLREHLRTDMLNRPEVWRLMLPGMPLTALIRNLAKMTTLKVFDDSSVVDIVRSKLLNVEAMKKAKQHPLKILIAQRTYGAGHGLKGHLTWQPNQEIMQILDKAFYQSFALVEPSGKRFLLALDISGSMDFNRLESNISCREAATCLAMMMMKSEEHCDLVGFHNKLIQLPQFREEGMTLDKLVEETSKLGYGATDCSKPMSHARKKKKDYDVFVVLTDNETNYHRVAPARALQKYRDAMNKPTAKLVVVGMTANNISIASPDDVHMLDVVGFDPDLPEVISEFITGGLE